MATNFQQETYASGDGKFIYIVKTTASNIMLVKLYDEITKTAKKLSETPYTGINGSFFDNDKNSAYYGRLCNIAVQDGNSLGVNGVGNSSGVLNGKENQTAGRGLIAWNGSRLMSKNEETLYENLESSFKGSGWVQGGIALRLGNASWLTGAVASHNEGMNYFTRNELRSAMVVNKVNNDVYLIVTSSAMSADSFRTRIQAYLGIADGNADNSTYAGILLDGGDSTQLIYRSPYSEYIKTTVPSNMLIRAVPQAIVLVDDT